MFWSPQNKICFGIQKSPYLSLKKKKSTYFDGFLDGIL